MPLPLDGEWPWGEPEPVEGERGAGAVLGDPGGGVGPGGGGELVAGGPDSLGFPGVASAVLGGSSCVSVVVMVQQVL